VTLLASQVIIRPVVSEKSLDLTKSANKYTFRVHTDATKHQIADAVAELFKVGVIDVNVLTSKSKEKQGRWRRKTRVLGRTSAWRKAVVTLKAGDKIEIFEGV
jgi:large subunit ribosomal protein L23